MSRRSSASRPSGTLQGRDAQGGAPKPASPFSRLRKQLQPAQPAPAPAPSAPRRIRHPLEDDRGKAEPGGTAHGLRWSTPVRTFRRFGAVTLMAEAEALWHEPAGPYAYLELTLDDVVYNSSVP